MKRLFALFVLLAIPAACWAAPMSIPLAGNDHTGFMSMSNVKNWSSEPDPVTQSPYPYFFDSGAGIWKSIAAEPLAAASTYLEESSFTVANKILTDPDFATRSSGTIDYDDAGLSSSGLQTIGPGDLSFTFNDTGFSPFYSPNNAGSGFGNFGWSYVITASNLTGTGLTFQDGQLVSIDLAADIDVIVRFGDNPALTWNEVGPSTAPALHSGTLQISGNSFAFDIDVTRSADTALGTLTDNRLVFNRAGTIAAVVPEPGGLLLAAASLVSLVGISLTRRHRSA